MSCALRISRLEVPRSGFEIVRGVDVDVPAGQVTVLLGPNGAGKTTLLEAVSGVIPASAGSIHLDGTDVTGEGRVRRARRGLSHVEQGRTVFGDLSVVDNLLAAAPRPEIGRAFEIFPELDRFRERKAGLLSGGEQQMLVVARAVVQRPKVLLLDEISLGLAPIVFGRLIPVVRQLADDGMAVLLVEQFAALALGIGDNAYVLSNGSIVFSGPCAELSTESEVLHSAYLS